MGQTPTLPLTSGPFQATRGSLDAYRVPEWFRDAKFGIWSHWGPQSGVEDGDWFARNMYIQGSPQYEYHLKTYGHPSKVGYKDLIPLFKGDKWDPEHLMDLYVKAGAKYFVSMGVHHDNFDMWNSKYQPRWNATATGPMRDIVGLYKQAARKRGLRFGVSEHLSNSFDWLAPAHTSDTTGPLAGKSYEGTNPLFADLYHSYTLMPPDFAKTAKAMGRVAPDEWKLEYFNRIKDLIDQHQPDLLYTDGGIPFDEYGLATVAEVYNVSASLHSGKVEAVYCSKVASDCTIGTCIVDHERGVSDAISPDPWQTDTCIGVWHYKRGQVYKTPKKVIDLLVDIVSKNGNLLLNFPLPNSGELDPEELQGARGDNRLDGRQQRRDLWFTPMEDLWRRTIDRGGGFPKRFQREQATRFDGAGCALHHQGKNPVRLRHGDTGRRICHQAAGGRQSAAAGEDSQRAIAGIPGQAALEAGQPWFEGARAGSQAV